MFKSPGEIAIHIGNFSIHWYGIIIAIAFTIGLIITCHIAKKKNIATDRIIDIAMFLLFGSIISARLYFTLFNWQYYKNHLNEILMLWQGGLSIHGGIIGGALVLFIYTRIKKLSLLEYTDLFSYGLILGQAIGRWGNFFNSEAFGSPTNLPWAVFIPIEKRPEKYLNNAYFHPTFLYESIWDIFVFIILYCFLRNKFKNKKGTITFSYLVLYSIGRFVIEGIRIDSIYYILGIPLAQFISLILIIIGLIGLYYVTVYRKQPRQ